MANPKLTEAQWGDIRTQWIATDRAVRDIAREFGVSDTAVNKRASKEGWGPRNAPARKRAIVASGASGLNPGLQTKPNQSPAETAILDAADQDIQAMRLASDVALAALRRCRDMLDRDGWEPRDIKALAETGRIALESYRRARNLDEPGSSGDLTIEWGEVVGRRQ